VLVIAVGAAVAAALSTAAPTGHRAADAVWCALFGLAATWVAARSERIALTWLAAVAAVVGVGGGWLPAVCGLLALGLAVLDGWDRRPSREVAALAGALAAQALLRGPSYGFLGLPTIVGAVAVVPAAVSAWRRAPRPERRVVGVASGVVAIVVLVAAAGAGAAALLARPDLRDAGDEAESALAILRDGELDQAVGTLEQATGHFSSASDLLDGPLAFAGRFVPVVGQHVEALRRVSVAGGELTATAGDAASSADYEKLKADNGTVDVAEVEAMAGPVRDSADALLRAQAVVADVRSPWLLDLVTSELDRLDDELVDTAPEAVNAADALAVAPRLLGADGPQRYLLQFATPGESRGAGGFVGTYGLLTADRGNLDLGDTGSTQELGPEHVDYATTPPFFPFDPPPAWDDLYGGYHVGYFPGNLSAGPDWPSDSEVARQIYAQVPGVGPVDGVLYADPTALAALLELTGPVEVDGIDEPLDASNVEQFLYVDQYVLFASDLEQRRDVLGQVSSAVFEALTSRPLPALGDLTDTLGPAVSGGHLKFVSFDPEAEALFERTGLAGAWATSPGADWLSLRSANLLPNKIDWFLHRTMDVESEVDPATGAITSTVTVTLRNDAPPDGLPEYLIANVDGLPYGTNHDALSLYTPHALTAVTVDGRDAPAQRQQGYGGNVYTVPVVVAPQSSATVVFRLEGTVPAGPDYRLDLLHQPLAHDDDVSVALRKQGSDRSTTLLEGPLEQNVQLLAIGR
jgi:hypothetical protein